MSAESYTVKEILNKLQRDVVDGFNRLEKLITDTEGQVKVNAKEIIFLRETSIRAEAERAAFKAEQDRHNILIEGLMEDTNKVDNTKTKALDNDTIGLIVKIAGGVITAVLLGLGVKGTL